MSNSTTKKAKEFQLATANHIEQIFRSGRQKRVLLADEVGLGKTIMAKEVIDRVRTMRTEVHDDMYRVVYVCSNINIVQQNTRNLGMEQLNISESRLSMQHLVIQEQVAKLKETPGKYREDGNYADGKMPELLIPLTPATSFSMQQGYGNMNERALMFCMVKRMDMIPSGFETKVNNFFRNKVKKDNWDNYVKWYLGRVDVCGEAYLKKVRARLEDGLNFNHLCSRMIAYLENGIDSWNEKTSILTQMRLAFAQISIDELEPDLVIMDEFQRFSSLIHYSDEETEQSIITRRFFKAMGDEKSPYILLLSATPYKPYTTLEELNETNVDEHYEDFLKLTEFLFTGEKSKRFKTIWKDYSAKLSKIETDTLDILIASKNQAEQAMYEGISRTERLKDSLVDMTTYVKENMVDAGDILSYAQMQLLLRDCAERAERTGKRIRYRNVPMEYVKSAPYLLSFMEKYELKHYIMGILKSSRSKQITLPISSYQQKILLNFDRIYLYKPLDDNNARLRELRNIMLNEKKRSACLLWIPASHPYYKTAPDNVFEQNKDFSKMLVFSAWEMVPRMIAFMLSYEAERLTIGQYTEGRKNATYTNKVGSDQPEEYASVLKLRSDYLVNLYVPQNCYGEDIAIIRRNLETTISHDIMSLGGNIDDIRCTDEYVESVIEHLDNRDTIDFQVPQHAIEVMVDMAIASPAIVLCRSLGQYASDKLIERLVGLFNLRQSTGIMSILYPDIRNFWERVLKYCVDGNFQSVIDEYIHMIDETGDNKEHIANTIYDSLDISPSNLRIDTTESFKDISKWPRGLRTHYALMFTNKKTDEKNVSRSTDVRQAFNSPFRPFVLSTTSIGQEGLDFHWYCRKIMHWNIPSNPQDMEQREGRINRYKCLAIRRNIAHKYSSLFSWNDMFKQAMEDLGGEYGGLVPYWCLPTSSLEKPEKIERIVPMYPLSSDQSAYSRMNAVLSLYRLTLGQPRQEELLELFKDLPKEDIEKLLFNLSPIKKENNCYGTK